MKKYLAIIKATWQRALTYRFTVASYRIGEVAEIVILIFMWMAIYREQDSINGYTLKEMTTYILMGNFINVMVRNWLFDVVATDIKDGKLSLFLIKPIAYFQYILVREIGRISLTFFMSIISQTMVILFFASQFILNTTPLYLIIIALMVILAFITELLLSFLIGLMAFWTQEVDGLHVTINRVSKFFAGGYFPLSLLSAGFVEVSFLLPFAYSFFVPAQLYLHKIDIQRGMQGIIVQLCWILLLYGIIKVTWKKGLRVYEGVGI